MFPNYRGKRATCCWNLARKLKAMAGATDIIPPMRDKAFTVEYLIDLKRIDNMRYIRYSDDVGLEIGALTMLREIETSPIVKVYNPAVAHNYAGKGASYCKNSRFFVNYSIARAV